MLKEIRNNVYHAEFVVADEDGQRYAAFEGDFNGEYWEATACTEGGELVKGETVKLYPVMVYLAESDQYKTVGYDEEAPRVLLPGWRDYQKEGYNESYSLALAAYNEMSDRVYFVLPEGASVCSTAPGTLVIDYAGLYQFDVINQYDGNGCRPYIIDNDRRRTYLEVVEL
ncbi:hypothetical protein [Phascolarctobacterium succinatutens]|uniref:hypothetical protein n=1 Tax=Phascolarctobacterium succinatutens TaxID=626940 RepID=UPI0026EFCCC4|nr:hypothetical protein [Phascolarctobacterium succinatutens]